MDVDTEITTKTRPVYRPTEERPELATELTTWRSSAHSSDESAWLWPLGDILSDKSINLLARAQSGTLKTAADVQTLLSETDEWTLCWADAILKAIRDYDSGLALLATKQENPSRTAPLPCLLATLKLRLRLLLTLLSSMLPKKMDHQLPLSSLTPEKLKTSLLPALMIRTLLHS